MNTMVTMLEKLNKDGFITQFKATENGLLSLDLKKTYKPDEVRIAHFYRFEGESNPGDSAILYAIETNDGEKGTLIDSYGISADKNVAHFIRKVNEIHK